MPQPVKASIWFLICSFFQKGISTITTPIFTRIMTTAEYGHYNVFMSWMNIITPIVRNVIATHKQKKNLARMEKYNVQIRDNETKNTVPYLPKPTMQTFQAKAYGTSLKI